MDISDWRNKIDELDLKLAALLNERAAAAVEIGRLKRNTSMPIYEPDRERAVIANVQRSNAGPLTERDLAQIYERIIDVMRNVQKQGIVPDEGQKNPVVEAEPMADTGAKLKIRGPAHERRKR
jgi:chorismate mutase